MKEIKLNMDEQREHADNQAETNESHDKSHGYDDETASVERIPEKIYDKVPGTTLLQKLTTVSYILMCVVICIFAIRTLNHVKTMNEYEIPETALVDTSDESTESTEDEEDVEYVEEVTYSPTELAKEVMAETNNGQDWSKTFTCPHTWTFKSDYEYSSANIRCVWLCTNDDTGELLAFRVADYNGASNEFTDPEVYVTKIGDTYNAAD